MDVEGQAYYKRLLEQLQTLGLQDRVTFTGYHRLEKDLWVDGLQPDSPAIADQLMVDINDLATRVKTLELTPVQLANGAKELLYEVATGKITAAGCEVLAGCMSVRDADAAMRLFTYAASPGATRRLVAMIGTPASNAHGLAASIACFAYGSWRPA